MDILPNLDEDLKSINHLKSSQHQIIFLNYHEILSRLNRKNAHGLIQSWILSGSPSALGKSFHSVLFLHGHKLFTFVDRYGEKYFHITKSSFLVHEMYFDIADIYCFLGLSELGFCDLRFTGNEF